MHRQNKAITEIIGTMLLLGITISLFSVVYVSVFTVSPPNRAPLANIAANIIKDVDGNGVVVIRHLGGNPIPGNAEIVIDKGGINQRVKVSSLLAENETEWTAGTTFRFDEGDITGVNVDLMIVDVDSNAIVMNHQLQNGTRNLKPSIITNSASGITTSSVDLDLQYDFKGFSGDVFFEYRKQTESWNTIATLTGLTGAGSHSTTINGLDDATVYEYRAGLTYTYNEPVVLYGSTRVFSTLGFFMNTSVDEINPFIQTSSPIQITASSMGTIDPDQTSLYYRFSGYNATVPWWNISWNNRQRINVSTGANTPYNNYSGYTVQFALDMTAGDFKGDGSDLRVVFWNGTDHIQLDREILDPGSSSARVRFMLQQNISAHSIDTSYYMYYNNPSAGAAPSNNSQVYLWYDNASRNREDEYVQGGVDDSGHGSGAWQDSITYDTLNGGYTFYTDDNFADSLRPKNLLERDVYVEYEGYQTNAFSNDMTSGPIIRLQLIGGSGGSERSDHFYFYTMAYSTFENSEYNYHDDIVEDERDNVVIEYGVLGKFPRQTWVRLGIASWGVNPTYLKAFYDNESGGWDGFRFSGSDGSDDNENAGQCGLWVQQDAGRLRNIVVRRYTEPEPVLSLDTVEQIDFESWVYVGNTSSSPIQWDFTFDNGSGFYEFYSIGWNDAIAASPELAPVAADARCAYNGG